ncbi:MFS general substrate transporter [Colletotrichum falcatum]|nr:MFS general substrate transporter [Colletotrichum falcatum]
MLGGLGNGLSDAAWNAWIGNLDRSNELLGFLHAAYGVGGVVSPLVATAIITRGTLPWYTFYYVVIGISLVEMLALTMAFWNHTGRRYREHMACSPEAHEKSASIRRVLTTQPEAHIAWLSALFVLIYIGVEVSLGGWVVEFLLRIRNGEAFASGMGATGYWLGITLGRILLPFVTNLLGLKMAVIVYLSMAMTMELIFWLVPSFYASITAVSLQGFFIGPMFPHAVAAVTSLLPEHLHVVVIGFVTALGGCGASLLPFALGALAQRFGVTALQPYILACLGVSLVIWFFIPHSKRGYT